MNMPAATTFRDLVFTLSPSWLRGFVGSRFMYSMAIQFDAIGDLVAYAVLARFPQTAPPDAFPSLANDRQIDQGFQEPQASYALRLTQYLDRWAHAGAPWGVLMAVRGWAAPDLCRVQTINNYGAWDYYAAGVQDGPAVPPTHIVPAGRAPLWNWDSSSGFQMVNYAFWRMWVVIYPSASTATQTAQKWGDGSKWGSGSTWGIAGPSAAAWQSMLAVIRKWKRTRTWIVCVIVCWDPNAFLPAASDLEPAGQYGTWSQIVANGTRKQRVRARSASANYVEAIGAPQ
jgi:hypothetical protein